MLLDFNTFYRNFGLRNVTNISKPRFGRLEQFQLPKGAIVHMAHGNPANYGPLENDVALQGFSAPISHDNKIIQSAQSRKVLMHHVAHFETPMLGSVARQQVQLTNIVREYHRHYKRFQAVPNLEAALENEASLLVMNYDILPHLVRYQRNAFNSFYEWFNIENTLWKNVVAVLAKTNRPQFVVRHVPTVVPARSLLTTYSEMPLEKPNQRAIKPFNNGERLFLAELWKWFGENRKQSLLSQIPREKLSMINIVFIESGFWTTINLGRLDAWRQPQAGELLPNEEVKSNLLTPSNYQNYILKFFMSINQVRTVAPEVVDLENDQVLDKDDADDLRRELAAAAKEPAAGKVVKVDVTRTNVNPVTGAISNPTSTGKVVTLVHDIDDKPDDTAATLKIDADETAKIEAELQEAEKLQEVASANVPEDDMSDIQKEMKKREAWVTTPMPVEVQVPSLDPLPHDEALLKIAQRHMNQGQITPAQFRAFERLASTYKTIQSQNPNQTLEQFIDISEQDKVHSSKTIPDIATVPDKSMLQSSLIDFNPKYTKNIMQRDVASMAMCLQQAGYAVTNYEVEDVYSVTGSYRIYTVRVVPVEGQASTLRFKLPIIDDDGTYTANGVKYNVRKQRTELPIVKSAPDTVALTSYYGKAFVRRSAKKVNNYAQWVNNQVMSMGLDDLNKVVTNMHVGDMSDNLFKAPRIYSILASNFVSFTLNPPATTWPRKFGQLTFDMSFDHTKREALYGLDKLKALEVDGAVIAGKSSNGTHYLVIDKAGDVHVTGPSVAEMDVGQDFQIPYGSLEQMLGLDGSKAPVDVAVINIAGEALPVGVILAYEIGLEPMLALLQTKIRRVPAGTRIQAMPWEASVIFNDEAIVFDRRDSLSGLLLGGFNEFHRAIRRYNSHLFNSKGVYLNVLEADGLNARHLRALDLLYQLFIDPITFDLLKEMGEPTEMRKLLIRATYMLTTDDHPAELDGAYLRLRGYERMAGAVYSGLVESIRAHNSNLGKSRAPLNMDPYAIFTAIQTDSAKILVEEINPIQNLKDQEAVTYNGTGGRNSRTMTKRTRRFHVNDLGMISTDTVDSSDVAINTSTSADPQITSLRGLGKRYDPATMGPTALLSTSALLSPFSVMDDPKRVNFIGIQNSHTVSCEGYHQMPVRTGYEQVIAQRTTGDMFAAAAPQDGKVISVSPTGIIVQFADGTKQGYEIGRRFGKAAGMVIPHDVVANVKLGQEFKQGRVLVYNTGFFEPDVLNPENVIYRAGMLVKTVLMDVPETHEDSSAISGHVTDAMRTKITKEVDIVVDFDQAVRNLVRLGQQVNSEDILCVIEDAVSAQANLLDETSYDTLRNLSNQAPTAKVKGVVERIQVYYHGDKEDMSQTLAEIANVSDKVMASRLKSVGKVVMTGSVDEAFRVEGEPLQYDTMCIRIYITSTIEMGEGDKGVFASQMKSVVGEKMIAEYRTQSGERIGACFGLASIDNRIVDSPYLIGYYSVISELIGDEAVAAYES